MYQGVLTISKVKLKLFLN